MPQKLYHGSCHCGAVKYEVPLNLEDEGFMRCNCSWCYSKNFYSKIVNHSDLKITGIPLHLLFLVNLHSNSSLIGLENVDIYQWGTKKLSHYACKTCHIYIFGTGIIILKHVWHKLIAIYQGESPRGNGTMVTGINVHTLHDVDLDGMKLNYMDGKTGDFKLLKTGTYHA